MVEINLLPWREYATERTRTKFKIIMAAAFIVLAVIFSTVIFVCRRETPVRLEPPQAVPNTQIAQLKKIKYVGYLHHRQHMWALIRMPDGKILDAHAGSRIGNTFRILSLDEAEVVLAPTSNSVSKIKILLAHS